ncbi:serine hydrolase domain-containing protein [Rhodobacter ferrooxidans]|uniref:Beta-lactamase n=1 Tax=Rhodobacter ferrooxidans TaxID=371731 RepID=C8RW95_9RHOB|nr:serine hydrolase [Rhodobacter sp. SW2]EEW26838.1 beta-lactamase [Rhodobacter sp. SW2]
MPKLLGRLLRLVLLLAVVTAGVAFWKREEVTRLYAVMTLFEPDRIVQNFSHMDAAFLSVPLYIGTTAPLPLPPGPAATLPAETDAWVADRAITALVVLKGGQLVHESYYLGTGPLDRRISWSVAKSFLSALLGIELAEGKIASLDDPVTKYAPQLVGSAYEGASIRNVLNMASGVKFDEDYLAFFSDINKMGRVIGLGGSLDDFAAGLSERSAPPGTAWQYVSIDTHVLGMVIRGATGREIPDLMSEKLLVPLGLEVAPYYVTDGLRQAFVLGGLNLITRDYARFGLLFANGGAANGQQIVPADWVEASTKATAPTASGAIGYGFQWWVPEGAAPGEFMARGVYGQYIYVNRGLGVVIAVNAADRGFTAPGVAEANVAMFRAIANSL